jgi:hypothetical protein
MGDYEREMTEQETRDYVRGYESAKSRIKDIMSAPMPAASLEPEPYLVPDQLRALPKGDRGIWFRTTAAGRLAAVMTPDAPGESADEARKAREWADSYEYTYGRRPSLVQARAAVARRSVGAFLSGDAHDFGPLFRQAGLAFAIVDQVEPLPADPAHVIFEPVTPG